MKVPDFSLCWLCLGMRLFPCILLIFDYAFVDMSLHRLTGAFLDYHKNAFYMNQMMGLKIEGVERVNLVEQTDDISR